MGESGTAVAPRLAFVLDDEAQVATTICTILRSYGFVPQQFCEPMPFFVELRACPPELAVLDLALGKTDAVEVMRHLSALKFRGKVLLVSGRDESILADMERVGQRLGLIMLPSLQKPFRSHDLKNRLGFELVATKPAIDSPLVKGVTVHLRDALRNNWLELWYQPKIDLKSLSVCGAEALVRARHPEHGVVGPENLLPRTGDSLYAQLSKLVFRQAVSDWERLANESLSLKLAINVPASVVITSDFMNVVREYVPKDPRFPGLIIEITEDEVIRDTDRLHEVAAQLKLHDIRLSIDDFGSAYSSLSRLREIPCIELKLDRAFVSGCSTDNAKMSLCSAAVDLAHGFGIAICAEGVDATEDLRALIEMGCDTAQGFLFAKPLPFEEFLQKFRKSAHRVPPIEATA